MSNRRRSTYLVLIAGGALALLFDLLVLRDTATTQGLASGASGKDTLLVASAATEAPEGPLPVPELPFPILDSHDTPKLSRDPFRRPGSPDNAAAGTDTRHQGRPRITSHHFGKLHRLDGVMVHERLKIAIVNGAWIGIGQSVGGCTLTSVSGTEARFSCDDGEATLRVGASSTRAPH